MLNNHIHKQEVSGYAFHLPERVWQGRGSVNMLGERLKAFKIIRPFIAIDPIVLQTDFGQRALESIKGSTQTFFIWNKIETNAPRSQVEHAADALRSWEADGIVAVGGGSTIDLAKAASAIVSSGLTLDELWSGKTIQGSFPPILAVPTTCGTGSEVNPFALVLDTGSRRKRGLNNSSLIPREAFLDADSLDSLPSPLVAATGFDALSHAMESFVSITATPLTKCGCLGTVMAISKNILKASNHRDPVALEYLLAGSTTARLLYPRTGLTIAHAMSHPIGAYFNLHHGEAVARATLPSLRYNAETSPLSYAEIARYLGIAGYQETNTLAVEALAGWIEDLFKQLNLVQNPLPKLDNVENAINAMAQDALRSSNIPSNPRSVGMDESVELLRRAVE